MQLVGRLRRPTSSFSTALAQHSLSGLQPDCLQNSTMQGQREVCQQTASAQLLGCLHSSHVWAAQEAGPR